LSLGQVIGQAHHLRFLTLPRSWRLLRPRTSSTVALACHHIQSHASKSLCLVTLDEVVGRIHVTGAHIVLEKLPPSAEIIGERHSSWVLHRHRCILKWVCSYPLRISDRLIDSWKSSDVRERGGEIRQCKVVGCYF